MTEPTVAGVDGARGAWVLARLGPHGASTEIVEHFAEVVAAADRERFVAVGVDMPIALPDELPRPGEAELRALLGARRSTLFPTPVAAVLEAHDYADACGRSRAVAGKALSKQMWHLVPLVRQVRAAVDPGDPRFVEVHPESTFVQLTGTALPSKKTAAGVGARLAALRPHVPHLDQVLADAPERCSVDDVLDALAAAVSARRFAAGGAEIFGHGHDAAGYRLVVVA